jgi:hypothetical protein
MRRFYCNLKRPSHKFLRQFPIYKRLIMKKATRCLLFFALLTACKKNEDKQQLIDQEVKNAVESFRFKQRTQCQTVALDSANKLVDSMIVARNTVVDTSIFAGKPVKPVKPVIKSALDTTPVAPILPKN